MKTGILPVLGVALIALAACSDTPEPMQTTTITLPPVAQAAEPTGTAVITTENLARIGARLHRSPENTAAILAEANMTADTFMALVEELSQDAAAANLYAQTLEIELARL